MPQLGLYMRPWKPNITPEQETLTQVLIWIHLFSFPIDYWRPAAPEQIGNTLRTFVRASEATIKKRYTSYARICVEMDVSGALHEGLWLEYRDEVYFQTKYYEKMPFRYRKCHEHAHLIQEFPQNKIAQNAKEKTNLVSDGFIRPTGKHWANRKTPPKVNDQFTGTLNTFEVLEEDPQLEKPDHIPAVEQETNGVAKQLTQPRKPITTHEPILEATCEKDEEGDEEMALSEIGIEDQELGEILENKGQISLHS